MAAQSNYVQLAQTLPPKLLRFFARFPPPAAAFAARNSPSTPGDSLASTSSKLPETVSVSTTESLGYENPFRNTKHPVTGNWHDPVYSLRRQADLVKLAREHGVVDLLPFTTKGTEERIRKRAEGGLRVKGTGVGQKVKGHWRERTMKGRLEKRRQAMIEMPKMIQTWKELGHGRGWKKYPK